jgi:hypothetical protein
MRSVCGELRKRFEFVIIDSPAGIGDNDHHRAVFDRPPDFLREKLERLIARLGHVHPAQVVDSAIAAAGRHR